MPAGGFFAALLLLAQALQAQAPRVEARLDTATARIGDPIRLSLTLYHDAATRLDAPNLPLLLEDFNPRCRALSQTAWGAGTRVEQQCDLRLYALGSHQVPAIDLVFITTAGDTLTRSTHPFDIEIVSARGEGDDQPRDIKPPLSISGGIPLWLAVALGVLALALLAFLAYWLWRRRPPAPGTVPAPAPTDFAAEFARIAGLGLLERGDFKIYYSLLSENLRRFLEQSPGIEAMEQTTSELARALRGAEIENRLAQRVVEYLTAADLVKFARFYPDIDAARRAPEAGVILLCNVETDIAARATAAETHAEHPV